jgi:hypothetical protein
MTFFIKAQRLSLIFNGITVTLLFVSVKRTGCFAVSALQPPGPPSKNGAKVVQSTFNYRLGVRLELGALV